MIRHLVEAVKEGQPKSVVLCKNRAHAHLLRLRVMRALYEAGVFYDANEAKNFIELEGGATILFVLNNSFQVCGLGHGAGVFSDHWTEGEE